MRLEQELAALADQETGDLERFLPSPVLDVPGEVALRDDGLWYTGSRLVEPKKGILQAFLSLSEPTTGPDQILAFARRWGTLRLCEEHGLPASHAETTDRQIYASSVYGVSGECSGPRIIREVRERVMHISWWEPLEAWKRLADEAVAILKATAELKEGRIAPRDAWHLLLAGRREARSRDNPHPEEESNEQLFGVAGQHLAARVSAWLRFGRVEPHFMWPSSGFPQVTLGSHSSFGYIALQLAMACGGASSFATCAACGRMFVPTRKPRRGDTPYCSADACKRSSRQAAKRASNLRSSISRLRAGGTPWEGIAGRLSMTPEEVKAAARRRRSPEKPCWQKSKRSRQR